MFALTRFLEHGLETPPMLHDTCTNNIRTPMTKTGSLGCDTGPCKDGLTPREVTSMDFCSNILTLLNPHAWNSLRKFQRLTWICIIYFFGNVIWFSNDRSIMQNKRICPANQSHSELSSEWDLKFYWIFNYSLALTLNKYGYKVREITKILNIKLELTLYFQMYYPFR